MTIRDSQRLRRSAPERDGPLRNPAKLFRPATVQAEGSQRAVEAAVETAYRVYEEYIGWGRERAAQRAQSNHGRQGMRPNNTPDMQAATYWIQLWQEAFRIWSGSMMPWMSSAPGMTPFGAAPGWPPGFGAPRAAGWPTPGGSAQELNIELESSQPTTISLRLMRPGSDELLKARLHREEGEGSLHLDFQSSNVRIHVPDGQTPGTYSGVVRDGAGEQCGMLTIIIRGVGRAT